MWRLSLRESLVLMTAVALAVASLKYASEAWLAIVLAVTMLAFFVALIVAVVDRGPRQAFTIGFALTMAGYWLVVLSGTKVVPNTGSMNIEFDHIEGRLPTTRLLRYVHSAIGRGRYFNPFTGQELPNYDPATDPNRNVGGGGFATPATMVSYQEIPPREIFMPIGHCWWGLLLAYLG
jgi:hypothetical protein